MLITYFTFALVTLAISYALYEMVTDHGRYNTEVVLAETGDYYDEFIVRYRLTGLLTVVALAVYVFLADDGHQYPIGISVLLILFLLEWRVLAHYYIRKNRAEKNTLQNGPA